VRKKDGEKLGQKHANRVG